MAVDLVNGQLFEALLLREDGNLDAFVRFLDGLSQIERAKLISSLLRHLTTTFFNKAGGDAENSGQKPVISAVAGLISKVAQDEASQKSCLAGWLTGPVGAGPDANIYIRRAVFASLAKDEHQLFEVLEKSMEQFGDDLYVKHTPMLQQEGRASSLSPSHCDSLTLSSTCTSRSTWCWISQPSITPEIQIHPSVAYLPRHGIEPAQLRSGHREVSRHGCGRSSFVAWSRERNKA